MYQQRKKKERWERDTRRHESLHVYVYIKCEYKYCMYNVALNIHIKLVLELNENKNTSYSGDYTLMQKMENKGADTLSH